MPSKMLLVDGNSLMHRAFHALPVMTSETGEYTNALHGFMMMLLRVMDEEKPDLIAVAFDHDPGPVELNLADCLDLYAEAVAQEASAMMDAPAVPEPSLTRWRRF